MEGLFLRIFTLSASVSLVLLPLLALLPRLRHRYAPRTCYFLWLLLALRLLLPVEVSRPVFTVATPSEVVVLPPARGAVGAQPAPGGETGRTQVGPDQGSQGAGGPSVSPSAQMGAPQPLTLTALAAWVWLAVGAALLVWQVLGYWLARRALCRGAVPVQGEEADLLAEQCRALGMGPVSLVRSEHTNTPVMLGLCKPVIVLPQGPMDREDLALVLRHELLHRKRWDVAYKGLMVLCTCVHWFNPLVWWLGREAGRNLELCCDDGVLQGGDAVARRRYGELLLRTAEGRALPFSTRFGGGKGQLKQRLSNLFEKKRNSAALVGVVLAAALLAGGLVACREGRVSESEAMDRLVASISYDGSTLSFTVPDVETPSHPWVIYLYGRAEMGPDNYRSTHYLEGEDWTPGETYTVPLGEEVPGMVELSMDLYLGQTERTIDLLPYLQRVSAPTSTPAGPETAPATSSGEPSFSIPLTGLTPYAPATMEPDRVGVDTMGEVLCDETLPDGTQVVCYWVPGSQYTKYWAIRSGDQLLRFCEEDSGYWGPYRVEPFTGVLGRDGFRIEAPRGAAYVAYDYYVLDETGTPRLLAACANQVVQRDLNGDGVVELLWFYHSSEAFCLFQQGDTVYEADLNALVGRAKPQWEEIQMAYEGYDPGDGRISFTYREGETGGSARLSFEGDRIRVDGT